MPNNPHNKVHFLCSLPFKYLQFYVPVISVTASTTPFAVLGLAVTSTWMYWCCFWAWTTRRRILHHVAGWGYSSCSGDMDRLRKCGCWGWCRVIATDPTISSLTIIVSATACPSSCNNSCCSASWGSSSHSCYYCSTVATFLFTTFLWLLWWLCPTVKLNENIKTKFLWLVTVHILYHFWLSWVRNLSAWILQNQYFNHKHAIHKLRHWLLSLHKDHN